MDTTTNETDTDLDLDLDAREEIAAQVEAAVRAAGYGAKRKQHDLVISVSRRLSGGFQAMGVISVERDGHRNYNGLTRMRAAIESAIEAALNSR